jgi:hypothetical protein
VTGAVDTCNSKCSRGEYESASVVFRNRCLLSSGITSERKCVATRPKYREKWRPRPLSAVSRRASRVVWGCHTKTRMSATTLLDNTDFSVSNDAAPRLTERALAATDGERGSADGDHRR